MAAFMLCRVGLRGLLIVASGWFCRHASRAVQNGIAERECTVLLAEIATFELDAVVPHGNAGTPVASQSGGGDIRQASHAAGEYKGCGIGFPQGIGEAVRGKQAVRCGLFGLSLPAANVGDNSRHHRRCERVGSGLGTVRLGAALLHM
ncbi:hypothetical protein HY78_20540 [Rhizorhabdus wittichii DC-6]|nr:hypothetical protein HY78_20540 [Rhizorhabdus wittichii DC-6]